MKKLQVILLAITLGLIAGLICPLENSLMGITFGNIIDVGGTLFLNSLSLLVIPLVSSAIISNLAQIQEESTLKQLGLRTLFAFISLSGTAVLLATAFSYFLKPGHLSNAIIQSSSTIHHSIDISQILYQIVPSNLLKAISDGNILGLIFFSILFGLAITKIEPGLRKRVVEFWQGSFQVSMKMTQFILKVMPIGVFCLVAKSIAATGLHSLANLSLYFLTVTVTLLIFSFLILPLIALYYGLKPIDFIRNLSPAILTAFSTSSSAASIPVAIDCMERRVGISQKVSSFVIPLGTSLNMAGSAIYVCVAVFFISQIYHIPLTIHIAMTIATLSFLTSMGVAGIPSGSLISILIILKTLDIPTEALSIIIPLDRILDMLRTTTNILSGAISSLIVNGKISRLSTNKI